MTRMRLPGNLARELPLFLLVAAFSVHFMELRFALNSEYGPGSLTALANHTAFKPFQYRILMPTLATFLQNLGFPPFDSLAGAFKALEAISVLLVVYAFRAYVALFFAEGIARTLSALSILYVLPFHFLFPRLTPYYYPYDLPSVFFTCAGLALMYRRRWVPYYVVFVLATLNRETSCFLTVTYLLTAVGRERPRGILLHCGAQALLWSSAKVLLHRLFFANPGPDGFEWYHAGTTVSHVSTNLSFLLDPANYPFLLSAFGFTWVLVLCRHALIGDEFVKRSLLVVFPFFLGMLFVGNIFELRVFGELIPIVLTASLVILRELCAERAARGAGGTCA